VRVQQESCAYVNSPFELKLSFAFAHMENSVCHHVRSAILYLMISLVAAVSNNVGTVRALSQFVVVAGDKRQIGTLRRCRDGVRRRCRLHFLERLHVVLVDSRAQQCRRFRSAHRLLRGIDCSLGLQYPLTISARAICRARE
jgi:hypothetical protein